MENTKKTPKISIVIPAHNEQGCLAETIKAALAQDYPDFEVIVVDNASSDRTSDVALEFPVKVVREERKGLLFARERGRVEATGEIVVNMDADCLPEKGWLSRGAMDLEKDGVVAASGPYYYFDGRPTFRWFSFFCQKHLYGIAGSIAQFFGVGAVLIGGNSFIKAEVMAKAGGYNTRLAFYGEDTDTAKRVSKFGKVIWDKKLVQNTSARRFENEGTLRIMGKYLFYFFKVIYNG